MNPMLWAASLILAGVAALWWTVRARQKHEEAEDEADIRLMLLDDAVRLASDTHRAAAVQLMLRQLRASKLGVSVDLKLQPELGALEQTLEGQAAETKSRQWDPKREQELLASRVDAFVRKWNAVCQEIMGGQLSSQH